MDPISSTSLAPLSPQWFVTQEIVGSITEWSFLGFIIALLIHGVWWSTSPFYSRPSIITNSFHLSLLILGVSAWLLIARFNSFPTFTLFRSNLLYDDFSCKMSILIVLSCLACLLLSYDYLRDQKVAFFEYCVLILLSCLGGCWLVASYDFFTIYLTIELLSLPLYALAAIKTRSLLSTEAGLKYFILGAFSSGVFLFGISLIYLATGSLSFSEIGQFGITGSSEDALASGLSGSIHSAYLIGMCLVLVGLLFKLTAVPFHMWAPDVYEGAPTPVTAYFSTVPKLAVFAITIRIVYVSFFEASLEWQQAIVLSAIGSILLGTIGAISQKLDIKRLLAYSAIGNAGYILLGISSGNIEGLQGILLFAIIYLVITLNAFATILALTKSPFSTSISESTSDYHRGQTGLATSQIATFHWERDGGIGEHSSNGSSTMDQTRHIQVLCDRRSTILTQNSLGSLKGILQFRTISKTNPLLAISIAFVFLSIAGVPPLAGFIGKMYLFFAAIHGGLYLAVFVGILVNVAASFYYIRCIKLAYFDGTKEWLSLGQCGKEVSLILGSTIFFLSFFFLFPSTTVLWVSNAAIALM